MNLSIASNIASVAGDTLRVVSALSASIAQQGRNVQRARLDAQRIFEQCQEFVQHLEYDNDPMIMMYHESIFSEQMTQNLHASVQLAIIHSRWLLMPCVL